MVIISVNCIVYIVSTNITLIWS